MLTVPSSSLCVWTLRTAAAELCAGASGFSASSDCSSRKSSGAHVGVIDGSRRVRVGEFNAHLKGSSAVMPAYSGEFAHLARSLWLRIHVQPPGPCWLDHAQRYQRLVPMSQTNDRAISPAIGDADPSATLLPVAANTTEFAAADSFTTVQR